MESAKYNQTYYESHCGKNYERNNGWEEIFGRIADHIVRELRPAAVLDVGCAMGYLVEALRDRGIEAEGIDISEYALSCVREDIKPFCHELSATVPIERKYDLITCIEVLEHLESKDVFDAIENMCQAADMVIFSSTPFDYTEYSHVSVHTPDYWAEQFAYHGFFHDIKYDCSYLSPQAMLFRRAEKSKIELLRDYESVLFQKHQENLALRHLLGISDENVELYRAAYQKHVDMINEELNPKISRLEKQITGLENEAEENEKLNKKLDLYSIENTQIKQTLKLLLDCYIKNRAEYAQNSCDDFYERINGRDLSEYENDFWNPVFNPDDYAEYNQDVMESIGKDREGLLRHFITYGIKEGRRAHKHFDVVQYISYNPDVVKDIGLDICGYYIHYINIGQKEGRRAY